MWTLLKEVSWPHVRRAPGRSALTLFGIALGVAMYVATAAVNHSILAAFKESIVRVSGKEDLLVTNADFGVPEELLGKVAEVPGVTHAAGTLEVTTSNAGEPVIVLGVDFLGDRTFLPFATNAGTDAVDDPLSFVNDPNAILVSERLAQRQHLGVDSPLTLLTSKGPITFTVKGIMQDSGPAASFDGQVAVMYLDAAAKAFGREGRLTRISLSVDGDKERVRAKVAEAVAGQAHVELPEARGKRLETIIGPFSMGITLSGWTALFVGVFLIYNTVGVSVAQRHFEIGLLRALGVTRRKVMALFTIEALALAGAGTGLGLLLGAALGAAALNETAPNVSRFYVPIRPQPPQIDLPLAIEALFVGLLGTAVAALLPARRAAQVDPVETLHRMRGMRHTHRLRWPLLLALGALIECGAFAVAQVPSLQASVAAMLAVMLGAALGVPALVLLLCRIWRVPAERAFGIPGRLAVDNVERSLWRSGPTVAALMLAVSSSMAVGAWGDSLERSMFRWLDNSVPADLIITAGSPLADQHNVPFEPEVLEKLRGLPGIRDLHAVRLSNQEVGPLRLRLSSFDTAAYFRELRHKGAGAVVLAGKAPIGDDELRDAPEVVIAENTASKLHLGPGDTLRFDTPHGPREFKVRAVIVDYSSDQGFVILDQRWYFEAWGDPLIDTLDVYLADGADPVQVAAAVRQRLSDRAGLFVLTAREFRDEIRRVLEQSTALLRSTDFVALIVALLGVVGTMLAAVLDRIREIGILRAIGAVRRQVAAAVVAESALLGLAAGCAGVLAALPMGIVMVKIVATRSTGWHMDYAFPWLLALRVLVGLLCVGAIAGYLPGRRAARMDVTEALAYE